MVPGVDFSVAHDAGVAIAADVSADLHHYHYHPLQHFQHRQLFNFNRNHRILDLRSFRTIIERGLVLAEDFVTIQTGQQGITTHHFKHAKDVHKYYKERVKYKVGHAFGFLWLFARVLSRYIVRWKRLIMILKSSYKAFLEHFFLSNVKT